ncbi:MAG: hypothetical protein QM802_19410 [Agriterribacter sp.]
MQKQLTTINDIQIEIDHQFPPALIIKVQGEAPGVGYSDVHLEPYFYHSVPSDGIFAFSLVGTAPEQEETNTPEEVEAAVFRWDNFPDTLKGIKVYADNNAVEKVLFQLESTASELY